GPTVPSRYRSCDPAGHGICHACQWLLLHSLPAIAWVEALHRRGELRRLRPEILLEDDAVLVHEEGHHARLLVGRRPGDQREAARELAVLAVVERATLGTGALRRENAVEIAV